MALVSIKSPVTPNCVVCLLPHRMRRPLKPNCDGPSVSSERKKEVPDSPPDASHEVPPNSLKFYDDGTNTFFW